ncbi:hypothetical protein VNO77_31209 [Canavalia gladiata]|uniref:Secreted protein n=1 Tax=Canavalia gladiata TaxID=3824 RepID=A0AAN9KP17_CANGL
MALCFSRSSWMVPACGSRVALIGVAWLQHGSLPCASLWVISWDSMTYGSHLKYSDSYSLILHCKATLGVPRLVPFGEGLVFGKVDQGRTPTPTWGGLVIVAVWAASWSGRLFLHTRLLLFVVWPFTLRAPYLARSKLEAAPYHSELCIPDMARL